MRSAVRNAGKVSLAHNGFGIYERGEGMEEKTLKTISKQLTTEKGEILTITAEIVNVSPEKKIVQELLSELFSEVLLEL